MKIADIRTVKLSAPFAEPMPWIGGKYYGFDHTIIELVADDGSIGLGEITQGTAAVTAADSIVEALRPLVIGQELNSAIALQHHLIRSTRFWARGGISTGTIGAVEVAAWDLIGQAQGVPVWKLLGGLAQGELQAYASTGIGPTFEAVLEQVREQRAKGFRRVKIRARPTVGETLELIEAVGSTVPTGGGFMLDASQGTVANPWTLREAILVGRKLADHGALWFEEPRRSDDYEGYAELRRKVDVPLAGVETYNLRADFVRLMRARGVDIVQPDSTIVGGITELNAVVTHATTENISVVPHTWGSASAIMANYHAAFANPALPMVEFCAYDNPLMTVLLRDVLVMEGDRVLPPVRPGLGITLSDDIKKEFGNVQAGTGISVDA